MDMEWTRFQAVKGGSAGKPCEVCGQPIPSEPAYSYFRFEDDYGTESKLRFRHEACLDRETLFGYIPPDSDPDSDPIAVAFQTGLQGGQT